VCVWKSELPGSHRHAGLPQKKGLGSSGDAWREGAEMRVAYAWVRELCAPTQPPWAIRATHFHGARARSCSLKVSRMGSKSASQKSSGNHGLSRRHTRFT